jgi:hypothetical protein
MLPGNGSAMGWRAWRLGLREPVGAGLGQGPLGATSQPAGSGPDARRVRGLVTGGRQASQAATNARPVGSRVGALPSVLWT